MTDSAIAHQRLRNQGIGETAYEEPVEVVRWLGAVQAQDYAGAKWSLALRLPGATDADLDRAFNEGAILRTHLLRPTWHFVTPEDIRWMLELTAPQVHAVNATMYRQANLDDADFDRAKEALLSALPGENFRTRDELRVTLKDAGVETEGDFRMSYLLMHAELEGLICSGPRQGKQFTYALLEERAPQARTLPREEALAELARRYFKSRGPASVHDFAKWSGLKVSDSRSGLEAVQAELYQLETGGQAFWVSTDGQADKDTAPTAYLLSIYDEYISGYKDRSAIVSEEYGARLWAMGNALTYIIVIDGMIAGTWKRTIRKDSVTIETNLFRRLDRAETRALAAAAGRYGEFLERSVEVQTAATG